MAARIKFGLAAVVALCGWFTGCSGDNPLQRQAISGWITLDGEPLEQGSISFEPLQAESVNGGATVAAGRFQIARLEGLPPGGYTVRINAAVRDEAAIAKLPPGSQEPPGLELVPAKYNQNSELTVEVKPGASNDFKFELQSDS